MTKIVVDDKARQAKPGRPVLYVLVASLVLAGIYMAAMLGWSGSTTPADTGQMQSQQTSNPSPSSSNATAVPAGNPAYPSPSDSRSGTTGSVPNR